MSGTRTAGAGATWAVAVAAITLTVLVLERVWGASWQWLATTVVLGVAVVGIPALLCWVRRGAPGPSRASSLDQRWFWQPRPWAGERPARGSGEDRNAAVPPPEEPDGPRPGRAGSPVAAPQPPRVPPVGPGAGSQGHRSSPVVVEVAHVYPAAAVMIPPDTPRPTLRWPGGGHRP